jgi:hypothetical protein
MSGAAVVTPLEIVPAEIFRTILQFLSLEELLPLDNAILNHRLRSFYLGAIEGMTTGHVSFDDEDLLKSVWCLNRKILPTRLNFFDFNHFSYPMIIDRSRRALRSLSLSQTGRRRGDPTIDSIFLFLGHFPSLTELDVSSIRLKTSSNFARFLSLNPQLKELSLPRLKNPSTEFIRDLSQACPNLTELDVSQRWFGDDFVTLLTQGRLSKLEKLDIEETSVREHDSIVNLLKAFPLLKSLRIPSFHLSMTTKVYFLNEYALPRLKSEDPQLQKFGIAGFQQVVEVRHLFLVSLCS